MLPTRTVPFCGFKLSTVVFLAARRFQLRTRNRRESEKEKEREARGTKTERIARRTRERRMLDAVRPFVEATPEIVAEVSVRSFCLECCVVSRLPSRKTKKHLRLDLDVTRGFRLSFQVNPICLARNRAASL